MIHLFKPEGYQAIDAFCMANTLFAFDYDGTLAPIVEDPNTAFMRKNTTKLLNDISKFAPVAIISGRARRDVKIFIPASIDYVIGNHGLEGLPGGLASLDFAETATKSWHAHLKSLSNLDGVVIENKTYSLAIHYRKCRDKRQTKAKILDLVSSLSPPPRIVMGKCVVNLISPGAPHKGVALLELMLRSGCRSAIYFGDDDNDEDVFTLGEESLLTVRVGRNDSSASLFYLESQKEVDHALERCVVSLQKSGKKFRDLIELGNLDAELQN